MTAGWRAAAQAGEWLLAAGWVVKVTQAVRGLATVARLDRPEWDIIPENLPSLVVVVPGRDEGPHVGATLRSLVGQDYAGRADKQRRLLQVLAVDDRSEDDTGSIMDAIAASHPGQVSAIHIKELPAGWLGKVHALEVALRHVSAAGEGAEYILFTDADVRFETSILRRTLAYAERERADHVVVMPTLERQSWSEGILLGWFHTFMVWVTRPWKVGDPQAKNDAIGVGAFNLVRRSALERLGGFAPQALVVLEDAAIARRIKAAGMRSRVAFAPGMVVVHWAKGVRGQMRVMGKNMFSAFNFSVVAALGASVGMAAFGLAPLFGLTGRWTAIPSAVSFACIVVMYRVCERYSKIPARYWWTHPLAGVLFALTVMRSMMVTLRDDGVRWRGTLYPLEELRRHNSPWRWTRDV